MSLGGRDDVNSKIDGSGEDSGDEQGDNDIESKKVNTFLWGS